MLGDFAMRHQPLKALFLGYQFVSTVFVYVPWWILKSIPRSGRPRLSWSIYRSVQLRLVRHLTYIGNIAGPLLEVPNHHYISPGDGFEGVWVEPVSAKDILGDLRLWKKIAEVDAIRIPGYWVHKKGFAAPVGSPPKEGEKVLYHLHGGGYVRLSAHPRDPTAAISRGMLKHCDSVTRAFSIEYRLSAGPPYEPSNPFPAALLDALAGYYYLVDKVGVGPQDIILQGDSAGANLALALTRYLVENKDAQGARLPSPPSNLLLLSPWCDISESPLTPSSSALRCLDSDYIGEGPYPGGMHYARSAYTGPLGVGSASTNRYISPASLHMGLKIDFKGFPRTFILAGGAEVLLDQIRVLKDRMIRDLGEDTLTKNTPGLVTYYESPDSTHDYLVFDWHEPERTVTFRRIAEWVASG